MEFRVPSSIPQDLQIIQDLIGEFQPPLTVKSATPETTHEKSSEDSVESSDNGSDTDSEREVEADILEVLDSEADSTPPIAVQANPESTSGSESSSDSDSDSEDEVPYVRKRPRVEDFIMDDDEEGAAAVVSPEQMRTKNEVASVPVVIPDIEQVDEHETLEKVGEVLSIVDKVVIVEGLPPQAQAGGLDRALDSDTLLVFEDRKVLGYVWETFGPTTQPFYRVHFNEAYPLDTEKVRVARKVFRVPSRSKFVSVSFLKQYKGSDASNVHDEEPAAEELEFSDDEAEREHKRSLKERRHGTDTSSRQTTPMPSRLRDEDMTEELYGAGPYSNALHDQDLHAGPSRPPPRAYDDPYSVSYGLPDPPASTVSQSEPRQQPTDSLEPFQPDRPRGRGRGRGGARDGPSRDRGRGRGRGARERGRGRGRGRGGGGSGGGGERDSWGSNMAHNSDAYSSQPGRAQSPTSAAIAHATGLYTGDAAYSTSYHAAALPLQNGWGYQQYPAWGQGDFGFEHQQPFIQPHINPRFASQFGLNLGYAQPMQYAGYEQYDMGYTAAGQTSGGDQWANGEHSNHTSNAPGDGNGEVKREPS